MVDDALSKVEPVGQGEHLGKSILVVDDDISQVLALEHRLDRQGFDVLTAHCGSAALRIARDERPDLVLLDLRLPDMHGFDVCAELADSPATCGMPIIIVSAVERPDIVRTAREVGCGYYVRKPYDPNVLLTLIENSLRDAELDW